MSNTGDPSAGTGSANNGDTGITGAMDKLTLDGEPIKSKRQVFKTFQFLVEEKSGLHVWKSAQLLLSGLEKGRKDLTKCQKRCGKDAIFYI